MCDASLLSISFPEEIKKIVVIYAFLIIGDKT